MPDAPTCLAPLPVTQPPLEGLPSGGCDCHAHVFGPYDVYPLASDRRYTPPASTLADYLHMLDRLGLQRGVLVQPSVYRHDSSCLMDGLRAAPTRLRGIITADWRTISAQNLSRAADAGVVGVRVNAANEAEAAADHLAFVAGKIVPLGWHIDLQVKSIAQVAALEPSLRALNAPVVIEAMGKMKSHDDLTTPGFQSLRRLLAEGIVWLKISHLYKLSPNGPAYDDLVPATRALIAAGSGRIVWGSDWPHPNLSANMPNDRDLLNFLFQVSREPDVIRGILSSNPAELYKF